ncbi:hypothetical protein DSO57_1029569 [Entomophthora muscae]|uniref:Uncharacterized protein n=1 Tax=Entomophthora muscae TaxID=34485 RepID=A0ACC2ULY9_9FUNG|nr:hypothetical protein DSO57_1029569 [Entomophthora muscae]
MEVPSLNPFLWKNHCQLKYLVSWKGYPDSKNSWALHYNCSNFLELIQEFYICNPNAIGYPKLTLAAMKLPPAHKNFSLFHLPDSDIVPQAATVVSLTPWYLTLCQVPGSQVPHM